MSVRRAYTIILATGLIIRLSALALQPAFCDEAFIYFVTKSQSLIHIIANEPHPPLWNCLMFAPISQTSNIALLRLPALLFSMLAIHAAFILGCRVKDEKAGLAMAGFASVSYPVWLAEIQLRPNAVLSWSLLSVIIMMIEIRKEGRPNKGWLIFIATAAICASIHYLGAVSIAFFLTASLFISSRRKAAICLATALVPIFAWTLWAQSHTNDDIKLVTSNHIRALSAPASLCGLETAVDIITDDPSNDKAGGLNQENALLRLILSIPFWMLFIIGFISILRQEKFTAFLLAGTAAFPALTLIAGSLAGIGMYQNRYLVFVSIPAAMLIYAGADYLKGNLRKISQMLLIVILCINGIICLAFPFNPSLWNQYWQSTINFIEANQEPGDKICIFIPYCVMTFAMDYDPGALSMEYGNNGFTFCNTPSPGKLELIPIDNELADDNKFLSSLSQRNVFLVLCQEELRDNSRIIAAFDKLFTPVLHFHSKSFTYWSDTECYLLRPKNSLQCH